MRQDMHQLQAVLNRLESKGYKAYKDIKGEYRFEHFVLFIDHVQGDPFATLSKVRVQVNKTVSQFPADSFHNRSREIAFRDYLARCVSHACQQYAKGRGSRGMRISGEIRIERPGQEILERSSVIVNSDFVEARILVGLPAFGRRIAGRHATAMLLTNCHKSSCML